MAHIPRCRQRDPGECVKVGGSTTSRQTNEIAHVMTLPENRALRYGIAIGRVFAAIVLLVMFFPWNMLRGPLASYMSARFDRPVAINGNLDVDLGWTTRMQIDGLSIANVAWSTAQPMVDAKRVILWFTLGGLLSGTPVKAQLVDTSVRNDRTHRASECRQNAQGGACKVGSRKGFVTAATRMSVIATA